jgi:DNA-binding response OmpR family regulator
VSRRTCLHPRPVAGRGAVWSDTAYVTPRSVDVYVRRIREKIEPDAEDPRCLRIVGGTGYRFESPK